ncbi:hypothetical protein BHE90_010421 [Fusarium euwallaceae]|uniref:NAD-dependent epimerase/dehydratase domain-containing protein n=1 Tax=Fusarium euwallaceae TaxID=1147111 RepID=A0A430LHB5_9HYPO|nr:hypothetical protein BHE90_010421 [Fusarium euwallaceae]
MVTFNIPEPAVALGSWVVVTGVSGLVGSHVADQALQAGYKVRGTTRSRGKNSWTEEYFQPKYGSENFELVEVPDMAAKGAFEKVVAGASGFIHIATDTIGSNDAHLGIPKVVDAAINAIEAAAKEPNMKRFVYTSSSFAATFPSPYRRIVITQETFNGEAVKRAWLPDPEGDVVYAASKVEAERRITAWVKENRPGLVVNMVIVHKNPQSIACLLMRTVLPNANIGPIISSAHQGYPTSSQWVKALCGADYDADFKVPAQHFVNVQDDARLHCIALAHPSVESERIFAVAGPVKSNAIIDILIRHFPQKGYKHVLDDDDDLVVFEPTQRAEKLLVEVYGTGFASLEESVLANAAGLGN